MKTRYAVALAAIAGLGVGAIAVEGLHAQGKPYVYYVAEIEVKNPEAYAKEYVPKAQAIIKSHGGRFLAAGSKITPIEGEPPKQRVAIQQWDSLEKIQAWRNSAEFKEVRKIGDKYAQFRAYAVEGMPQQ
jgi:uncharacterized protein (DUF1330 family)